MKTRYEQRVKVLSAMTDCKAQVGITNALCYLQDNMSEYFKSLGCDGPTMIKEAGCFWVMTKTKIKFNSNINWLDYVSLLTDICKKTAVRINIVNSILDDRGNIAVEGIQEICAVDSSTRKLRPVGTTTLPQDIEIDDYSNISLSFTKLEEELGEDKFIKSVAIDSRYIDFFGHTNNVEYAKILLSTFTSCEIKKLNVKEFEIHYISESREGEELSVYRDDLAYGYYFEIKSGERVVCKAVLSCDN